MKKTNKKAKIITVIAIVTVIVFTGILIATNVIKNNNVNNESYLATANANSDLVASYIKSGVTIGGITGTLEVLDTSDADATSEDILSGKTAYVKGEKITGTYTKTTNIIDLGTGTSFNVSNYNEYKSFTTSNFLCEPINGSSSLHGGSIAQSRYSGGINFSKSYNSDTGILNVNISAIVYFNQTGGGISGTYGTYTYGAHVYLVY